jgi:hypothetical protein
MSYPQVRIKVSEPVRISPLGERHWFPRLFVLPDGRILQFDVTVDDRTEALQKEHGSSVRVADATGQGWREVGAPRHYSFPVALKDGTIRSFSYINWQRDDGRTALAKVADLDPVSMTWIDRADATIDLPTRSFNRVEGLSGMEIDRSVLLESDGSLLATMYGYFEGDGRRRSIVVRSTDDGASWEYVSTIARDPAFGTEGFNEPVMARVKDSSLLVLMRTSTYCPIHQTRSLDGGKTWGPPENLGVLSVDPELCLMRNGVLASSFGRPTVQLMFSLDGSGYEWTAPHTIYSGPRVKGNENSTCYTGLRELPDGRLLLVYDTNTPGLPWNEVDSRVNAVFIEVDLD